GQRGEPTRAPTRGQDRRGAALGPPCFFPPFGIGTNALNPRGSGGGSPRAFEPPESAPIRQRPGIGIGCHGLVYGFARSRSCRVRLHPYTSLREYVRHTADAPPQIDVAPAGTVCLDGY